LRYVGGVPRESIYLELLHALAARPGGTAALAPELAKALGTSPQFVVAKLRPLISAGLVSRQWVPAGRAYVISEEGREYLIRIESSA
jgi:predicted transcriptional regulator